MSATRTDLLPCPFCGVSKPKLKGIAYRVECRGCGAEGPTTSTKDRAVLLWNSRVSIPERKELPLA